MGIYDSIGGAGAVQVAVEDFYVRVVGDPQLAPFFADIDMAKLKGHQRAFIAAALGGPEIYAGRDLGAAHAGLDIGDADFDAVVGHLAATLTSLGVDDDTIGEIAARLSPLRPVIVTDQEELVG